MSQSKSSIATARSRRFRQASTLRQADELGGEVRHLVETLRAMAYADYERGKALYEAIKESGYSGEAKDKFYSWKYDHAAFHGEDDEPLPDVVALAEQLASLGGKKALRLAIEAMPPGWHDELNQALSGIGGWKPLKLFAGQ